MSEIEYKTPETHDETFVSGFFCFRVGIELC